jgi:NADH-quinone oxidoreductase subunit G
VVLPIGSFAESSGTFVNAEGRWQSWAGAAKLVGESRPGWKVLRVLANLLGVQGVDYVSSDEVLQAVMGVCGELVDAGVAGAAGTVGASGTGAVVGGAASSVPWMDIPPYQGDVLVRGSEALSKTKDGHVTRNVV